MPQTEGTLILFPPSKSILFAGLIASRIPPKRAIHPITWHI